MQTYAVLSKLLLQLSLPLGVLASLCILIARLRKPHDANLPSTTVMLVFVPVMLVLAGLTALLGQWLWQAAQSGAILSCGDAGCFRTLVPLADNAQVFWLTAVLYWLGLVLLPVLCLLPPARWLMQMWRSRRETPYLDTEPV